MFEYIYFARPDSVLSGRSIYMARYEMGRALAREHPVDADVVMAVPDSAIPGGIGYAAESGLPYVEGLIKNRYIGRTFISPDQKMRSQGVQLKFNPIVENLRGQRVVVVDDSIVRGTTTPRIVSLLRDAGAREVHLRITSPPIVHPCYLGVDMATYEELIAANLTVPQICERVGADSLGYLSIENLVASTGREPARFLPRCLTGRYPSVPGTSHGNVQADRQPALKGLSAARATGAPGSDAAGGSLAGNDSASASSYASYSAGCRRRRVPDRSGRLLRASGSGITGSCGFMRHAAAVVFATPFDGEPFFARSSTIVTNARTGVPVGPFAMYDDSLSR